MKRTKIKELLKEPSYLGQTVQVMGWIRTVREQKNFSFLEVSDGSSQFNLQAIVEGQSESPLTTGSSVALTGKVVESPQGAKQRVELKVEECQILGGAPSESYPLQKKRHSFEFLRTIGHLRPRTNTFGALARVRNRLSFAVHSFFQKAGFIYLHSPIITLLDAEGGGEMFQVTTLDLEHLPKNEEGHVDYSQDFFGHKASLTVSGQLNAEIYALALSDVYTFGPTFRAENSNTSRHLAEFWMIEPEMAFATLDDDMALAESFLKAVFADLMENCADELAFFDQLIKPGVLLRLKNLIEKPFARITYTEAIELLQKSGQSFEFPVTWGADLQAEHERYLAEKHFNGPVIVRDYPERIKAFYMRRNGDGKTVAAMDILVPDVGEIVGGSAREEREDQLLEKMRLFELSADAYSWYLDLRRFGGAPHAGFGVGFERLLLFATGMENIRDVIPFPRTPGVAAF